GNDHQTLVKSVPVRYCTCMSRPRCALLPLLFVACTGGSSGTDATHTSASSATEGTTAATTGGSDSAPTTSAGSDSASGTTSSGDSGDPTGTTTDAASSTGTSTGGDMNECTPGEVIDCYSGP